VTSGGEGERPGAVDLRGVVCVALALVVAAATLETLGLIVAVPALVVVSSLASPAARPVPVVLSALGLTAFGYLVFVRGLDLPVALLPRGL
jgi:hypothetical protein